MSFNDIKCLPDNGVKWNPREQNEMLHEIEEHKTKSDVSFISAL